MTYHCQLCDSSMSCELANYYDDRHGSPGRFSVYICPSCGFGKTFPSLKPHQIQALYTDYYPRQHLDISTINIKDYMPQPKSVLIKKGLLMNAHYHVTPGAKVLDVGSGVGYSLLELKNMGCYPYGLDPDHHAQQLAAKYKIPFHLGFIEDHPFAGTSFDYVVASQVLEHTLDPVAFLRLCASRLKPNGQLILSFPNYSSLTRHLLKKRYLHWHLPYHQNFFSKKTLLPLAQKSGLVICDIKTYTPNLWTNLQIRHLLTKHQYKHRDPLWDGARATSAIPNLQDKFVHQFFQFTENHNPLNRLLDHYLLGDSFLIKLRLP